MSRHFGDTQDTKEQHERAALFLLYGKSDYASESESVEKHVREGEVWLNGENGAYT